MRSLVDWLKCLQVPYKLRLQLIIHVLGTFRLEYEYKLIKNDCDFSKQVLMFSIVTFHKSRLFNWSAVGRSESSRKITGLKLQSPTHTLSCQYFFSDVYL